MVTHSRRMIFIRRWFLLHVLRHHFVSRGVIVIGAWILFIDEGMVIINEGMGMRVRMTGGNMGIEREGGGGRE